MALETDGRATGQDGAAIPTMDSNTNINGLKEIGYSDDGDEIVETDDQLDEEEAGWLEAFGNGGDDDDDDAEDIFTEEDDDEEDDDDLGSVELKKEEEVEELTEVDILSDELFDQALEAGLKYQDIKDLSDAEVKVLLMEQGKQITTEAEETPKEEELKTGDAEASEFVHKLDPEKWKPDVIEQLQPALDSIGKLASRCEQLENYLMSQVQEKQQAEFTSTMDNLFNTLESDEFGSGTAEKGLSKEQFRARKAAATVAGRFLNADNTISVEDAFSLAVKRVAGESLSAGKDSKSSKGRRSRVLPRGTARGKTRKGSAKGSFKERVAEASEIINSFCDEAGGERL